MVFGWSLKNYHGVKINQQHFGGSAARQCFRSIFQSVSNVAWVLYLDLPNSASSFLRVPPVFFGLQGFFPRL